MLIAANAPRILCALPEPTLDKLIAEPVADVLNLTWLLELNITKYSVSSDNPPIAVPSPVSYCIFVPTGKAFCWNSVKSRELFVVFTIELDEPSNKNN